MSRRLDEWAREAGCLERGVAMGYPPDQCDPNLIGFQKMASWKAQPFFFSVRHFNPPEKMLATRRS